MLILQPHETRGLISMAEAVEATEVAFHDWGLNHGFNAPRRRIHVPSGVRVSVHQGGTPSLGMTGLFTHCELVRPMASHQEYDAIAHPVYVLFDGASGELACVILGEVTPSDMPDTVVMTGLRTAATSAVGTKALARRGFLHSRPVRSGQPVSIPSSRSSARPADQAGQGLPARRRAAPSLRRRDEPGARHRCSARGLAS